MKSRKIGEATIGDMRTAAWMAAALAALAAGLPFAAGSAFAGTPETLYSAPKSVTDLGQYKYDLQDPSCWTNGLPRTGMTAVFQRGAATAYATNSAPLYAQNLKFIGTDFYVKSWGSPFVLDSETYSIVSGSSIGVKMIGPLQAKVPVKWETGGSSTSSFDQRGPAVFEDELFLTGQFKISGEAMAGNTLDVPELAGYPGAEQSAALIVYGGGTGNVTATITNTARFGGLFGVNMGTLRTPGGDLLLNDPAVAAELVTDGLAVQFDASDESSFTFTNGNRIVEWRDKVNGLKAVPLVAGHFPWWRERDLGTLAAVDFGGYGSSVSFMGGDYVMPLRFETSISGAKTVFFVLDSERGGGWLFANESDLKRNFHRASKWCGPSCAEPWATTTYNQNPNATLRVNGRDCDIYSTFPGGTYEILTVANAGEAFRYPIAGFAFDHLSNGTSERSGGQRIGEFLAYSRALSADEVKKVEKYLYRKWFAGRADLRQVLGRDVTILDIPVSASEGHEVHLGRFNGRSSLVKKGAGALVVDRPRDIPERIEAEEGTLVFETDDPPPRRAGIVPALPESGVILHLDASVASSYTLDETGDVVEWRDISGSGNRLVPGKDGAIKGYAPAPRPHLLTGRTMIDFGGNATVCFMNLETRVTTARTVLYAVDARNGGGHLLSDVSTAENPSGGGTSFHRGNCPATTSVYGSYDLGCTFGSYGGELWNGLLNVSTVRDTPAGVPQVLVWTGRSGNRVIGRIGMDRNMWDRSSGIAVGELVVYNRVLTDAEMAQAVVYLEAKWLDRTAPLVCNLDATGDAVVEARDGSLAVDTLSGSGALTAKGGTITVNGLADFAGNLRSDGGVWDIRNDRGAAPASNPVTDGLIAHFDPSDATLVTTNASGEVTEMASVNDPGLVATPLTVNRPILDTTDTAIGKRALLNCGGMYSNKGLAMSTAFTNVHTVICVYKPVDAGGQLFGSSLIKQAYQRNITSYAAPIFANVTTGVVWCAAWRDGRYINPRIEGLKNAAQMLTFIWPRRMYLDWLGMRENNSGGGQAYGEVLMWNRCLSDEERKSVEAYLSAKWFSKAIHGYTIDGRPDVPGYETSGAPAEYAVAQGDTLGLGYLTGDAGIVKSGDGVLELDGSTAGLTGELTVNGGTLAYGTTPSDPEALPVTAGLIAQFEAGVNMVTNEAGIVTEWRPKSAAAAYVGYKATQPKSSSTYPKYEASALNGRGVIDFGPFGSAGCGLYFDPATHPDHTVTVNSKEYGVLPNCKTVLLMFNSENGGGFVVGNLGDAYYHRGWNTWGALEGAIFSSANVQCAGLFIGSEQVGVTQHNVLNGDWQMVEIYKTGYCDVAGFAHDRCMTITDRQGGHKLAEAVFFDRVLTDEEKLKMRLYFYNKWHGTLAPNAGALEMMYAHQANAGRVEVASGATFDLNGYTQNAQTLVCAGGTVVDGDLLVKDAIEHVPGQTLTVNGKVTFGEEGRIVVSESVRAGLYKLISAEEVVLPNPAGWRTNIGSDGNVRTARLWIDDDGGVWLRLGEPGMRIIFR